MTTTYSRRRTAKQFDLETIEEMGFDPATGRSAAECRAEWNALREKLALEWAKIPRWNFLARVDWGLRAIALWSHLRYVPGQSYRTHLPISDYG